MLRYQEQREGSWRLRHTGVYHSYRSDTDESLLLCLHPGPRPEFQAELGFLCQDAGLVADCLIKPMVVHECLFNIYGRHWRQFLREQGEVFQDQVNR